MLYHLSMDLTSFPFDSASVGTMGLSFISSISDQIPPSGPGMIISKRFSKLTKLDMSLTALVRDTTACVQLSQFCVQARVDYLILILVSRFRLPR